MLVAAAVMLSLAACGQEEALEEADDAGDAGDSVQTAAGQESLQCGMWPRRA